MIDLELTLKVLNGELTTQESLRIALTLRNIDSHPADIPSPYDRTDALTICLFDGKGKLLRSMNGLTSQAMMSRTRIDNRKEHGRLDPGKVWTWEVDLCQYHYAFPAGEHFVSAVYRIPSEGIVLETPRVRIAVSGGPLISVARTVDNPVTERMNMLFSWNGDGKYRHVLRHYNHDTPLACWYTQRIPEDIQGKSPLISKAIFFQTRTFDPAFVCWLAWQDEGVIAAGRFEGGKETGPRRSAALPAPEAILRYSFHTLEGELFLLFELAGPFIACYRFVDGSLEEVFSHSLKGDKGSLKAFHASGEGVDIITADHLVKWERVSMNGGVLGSRELYRSRLRATECWYDPSGRSVKAIFRDSSRGSAIDFVSAGIDGASLFNQKIDHVMLRLGLHEISFAFTRSGRLQFLASTNSGRLYYGSNAYGVQLIERGGRDYFPHLLLSERTYLGYLTENEGYRYRVYDRHARGSHLINLEEKSS